MSDRPSSSPSPDSDPLQAEIDAALEGVRLQDVDAPIGGRPEDGDDGLKRGTVTGVQGSDVFVELGPRMQGVISVSEFDEPPAEGDQFDFTLHGQEDGLWVLSRRQAKMLSAWRDISQGAIVKATVVGHNPGGLDVTIGPLSAFLPGSHVDLGSVEDLSSKVGETLVCEVLEVDSGRKRIVVSRRAVLARERDEARKEVVGRLQPGETVRGRVTRLESYGAFVEIAPGIEGLVHVSNLSRKRVENPEEVLKKGDTVEAMVLEVKEGGKRIGLGIKQLQPDPWDDIHHRFRVDQVLNGRVTRLAPFGAFVEIADGLEGLLHVSQMGDTGRNTPVHKLAEVGQELPVRIQNIDAGKRRLSLTRYDARGALIGSEDAVEAKEVDKILEEGRSKPLGTNLGDLLGRALKDK